MSVRILANFHVFEPQGQYDSGPLQGKEKPGKRINFVRGQTVTDDAVPQDQSAQDWIDKGLAEAIA